MSHGKAGLQGPDLAAGIVANGIDGKSVDVADGECAVAFRQGRTTLAVAAIFRDDVRLEAELALGRGDQARLAELVPFAEGA